MSAGDGQDTHFALASPVTGVRHPADWASTLASPGFVTELVPPQLRSAVTSRIAGEWLAVALVHKSWLHEERIDGAVNGPLLSAFAAVGQSALQVELLACLQATEPDASLPRRHESLAQRQAVLSALVDALELSHCARLSRGEESERHRRDDPRRQGTLPTVAAQVLGWWSLFGDPNHLRRLVAAVVDAVAGTNLERIDSKTLVQQHLVKFRPTYTVTTEGPDHDRVFEARVALDDGRYAVGAGRSKKLAEKAAALALLQAHVPHAIPAEGPSPDAVEVRWAVQKVGRQDAERYVDVAAMFACRRAENFALAMTHRSWTYEYSKHLHLEGGSNALLALNGRYVFDLVFRRLRLIRLLQSNRGPTQEQAALTSLTDADMAPMLDELDLRPRLRMGLGQRSNGITTDIASNCVQALFGAAYIEHRHAAAVEAALPGALAHRLDTAASIVTFDPLTKLHRLGNELGITVTEVASVMHGEQHDQTCESTLELQHATELVRVHGEHSNRRGARQAAASVALAAVEVLNGKAPTDHDPGLVSLLVKAQIGALNATQHWNRWVAEGRLGTARLSTGDTAAFDAWAGANASIAQGWEPDSVQSGNLALFLRFAGGGGARPRFRATLDETLEALDALSADGDLPTSRLAQVRSSVAALTAAHAVHLSDRNSTTLGDLVDDWVLVSRRVVNTTVGGDGSRRLGPRSATVTTRILHEVTATLEATTATRPVALAVSLHTATATTADITLHAEHPWTELLGDSVVLPLVLEAAPGCSIRTLDPRTLLLTVGDTAGSNWLTAPLLRTDDDPYEHELARLLHDLKNELTAVATAARPQPGAGRSERLAQELTASRHLDSVAGLTLRLRMAGLETWHTEEGEVELDPFLRRYCADLMRSVPAEVHVVPPAASTAAMVAASPDVLKVVLDNLTKNAVEAMNDHGQIRIDAVATDSVIMLEVADSGPGVPPAVIQGLRAGHLAISTKRTGSGLGLASVQRLLRPLGGQLDWTATGPGHTWLVVLPISKQYVDEE